MPGKPPANDEPVYTIGVAMRMTGLTARQIRHYESKGLVIPKRSAGNQRLYSKAQIERLKEVRALRDEHLPLESILNLLENEKRG